MKSMQLKVTLAVATLVIFSAIQASGGTLTWQVIDGNFDDGAVATGSFDFDASTKTVSNWNISVEGGSAYPPLTYEPSVYPTAYWIEDRGTILFQGPYLGPHDNSYRQLRLYPMAPLTETCSVITLGYNNFGSLECNNCSNVRILTGSLTSIGDADQDGVLCDTDCDDNDSSVYPGASELCDMKDNDCDGIVPEDEVDNDGDGYMVCAGDCDDGDYYINPDAYELPGNAIDENCDGSLGDCDPGEDWRNHGQYVRCVAHETDLLIEFGVLTQEEGDVLISSAAESDIGKK